MILLLGAYGQDNLGDEALLEVHLQQLKGLGVTVASSNPQQTSARYGVPSVSTYGLDTQRALLAADHVVFGGGSVLKELPAPQARHRLLMGIAGAAALRGRHVSMSAVGVERLTTGASRLLAGFAGKCVGLLHVRDEGSLHELETLGIRGARVVADPAYLLEPEPAPAPRASARPLVVLNPMRSGEVECAREIVIDSFAALANHATRTLDADVLLLPFKTAGMDEDLTLARDVAARAPGARVEAEARPSRVLSLLAGAHMFVGMRHHGALLALHAGAPALAVPYAPKTERLVEELGIAEHALPAARLSPDALIEAFDAAIAARAEIVRAAQAPLHVMRRRARENFTILRRRIEAAR